MRVERWSTYTHTPFSRYEKGNAEVTNEGQVQNASQLVQVCVWVLLTRKETASKHSKTDMFLPACVSEKAPGHQCYGSKYFALLKFYNSKTATCVLKNKLLIEGNLLATGVSWISGKNRYSNLFLPVWHGKCEGKRERVRVCLSVLINSLFKSTKLFFPNYCCENWTTTTAS